MLKFSLNDKKDEFVIKFDIPVNSKALEHEEFKSLLKFTGAKNTCLESGLDPHQGQAPGAQAPVWPGD